jgi:hypothetical protein
VPVIELNEQKDVLLVAIKFYKKKNERKEMKKIGEKKRIYFVSNTLMLTN